MEDNVYCLFCGATPTEPSEMFQEPCETNNRFYYCERCGYTWCISCVTRGGGKIASDKSYAYCPRCRKSKMTLEFDGDASV